MTTVHDFLLIKPKVLLIQECVESVLTRVIGAVTQEQSQLYQKMHFACQRYRHTCWQGLED